MAVMRQPGDEAARATEHVFIFMLGEVPERWRSRARAAHLIPLLPYEVTAMLAAGEAGSVEQGEDDLLRLAARGAAPSTVARSLGLSVRTVHRRLALLRDQFGVDSTAELAAELSRRGFGE